MSKSNELEHFGVLGMRWGVRRGRNYQTSAKKSKKVKVKNMSDQDLQKKINRMNMEKQYKQLKKEKRPGAVKFVSDIIYQSSKESLKNVTTKYMTKGLNILVEEALKKV